MSFFSNFSSDRCPGQITGNPASGLCEKVCIQVNKVFDACLKQGQEDNVVISITQNTPANPTYPLTFVSAKSTSTEATLTGVSIDRLQDRPNFARVQATVGIPVEVIYTDANGVEGVGTGTASFSQDVILYVPEPSVIPYSLDAVVSLVAPEGTYIPENSFSVTCCTTIILKIVMETQILVPSYGYTAIPPCNEYSQEVCSGFFELPLYPNSNT